MKRREFIRLFGSTVVAWPLTARAQQAAMPIVAYLSVGSLDATAGRVNAFRKGLGETGYAEGPMFRSNIIGWKANTSI